LTINISAVKLILKDKGDYEIKEKKEVDK